VRDDAANPEFARNRAADCRFGRMNVMQEFPRNIFNRLRLRYGLRLVGAGAFLGLLGLATAGSALFGGGSKAGANTAAGPVPAFVRQGMTIMIPEGSPLRGRLVVRPVDAKPVTHRLVLPAVVEADPAQTAKVLPPLAGRIVTLNVALGDHVVQGQALAAIASAELAQAYNDEAKAQSALQLAGKALDRQRALIQARAGAVKDLEAAEDAYTQAEAEHKRTQARLKQIGASDDPRDASRLLTLAAPISGTVTDLGATRGTFFNDPNQPLMTISQLDTVWVTASVPEKDIALIRKGQPVDVTLLAYSGVVLHGNVLFISDVLEPDTRRTKVRIAFANPDGALKPNMFATAIFLQAETSQLVLPTSSLIMNNDSTTIFVETAPWMFERREIEVGNEVDKIVSVAKGVSVGERVVVAGGVLLND
jgi:cobalt-zinc-cadmium efflux system membrane fusion protein